MQYGAEAEYTYIAFCRKPKKWFMTNLYPLPWQQDKPCTVSLMHVCTFISVLFQLTVTILLSVAMVMGYKYIYCYNLSCLINCTSDHCDNVINYTCMEIRVRICALINV